MDTAPKILFSVPIDGPGLMKTEEVAAILRYHPDTLYEMVESGELEIHRRKGAGRTHMRFTRRSVIALLAISTSHPTNRAEELIEAVVYLARTLTPARRRAFAEKLLKE